MFYEKLIDLADMMIDKSIERLKEPKAKISISNAITMLVKGFELQNQVFDRILVENVNANPVSQQTNVNNFRTSKEIINDIQDTLAECEKLIPSPLN